MTKTLPDMILLLLLLEREERQSKVFVTKCGKVVTKCGSFLLSQSAAKNCYKVRQLSLLQSAAKFVTKCGSCYKVRQNLLQSAAVVTKCGNCYKVEHNKGPVT